MSPDEGMPVKLYDHGTVGAYMCRCATCPTRFIGHKSDVTCPTCAAHRASGEGGSTSALRASAPEGIDVMSEGCTGVLRDALRSSDPFRLIAAVAFELRCIAKYHQHATKAEVRVRAEFLVKLSDLLTHATQAVKQAIPSPAPQAPPPEGFTVPTQRVIDARAALRELVDLKDMHDRIESVPPFGRYPEHDAIEADYAERKPKAWAEARRVLATWASVDAGNSRGADAPLAPEGQDAPHEMGYALTCAERERDEAREMHRRLLSASTQRINNLERALHKAWEALAVLNPPTIAASVSEGQPSALRASAPEDFSKMPPALTPAGRAWAGLFYSRFIGMGYENNMAVVLAHHAADVVLYHLPDPAPGGGSGEA